MPPNDFNSLAHFVVYALLAVAIHFALSRDHDAQTVWVFAILLASAYGVVDEVHQSFVPGRTPDVVDWGWDTLGAAVGASVARSVSGKRLHQPKGHTPTIRGG
ncbi:MAG: VanZ family protein [Actinobacteria bacterium]|nr:VanZ family protein [Actinomycetota bacterium]MCL5887376.1 VanZ family protein [Actinomycetota bacterium]MCL5887378.1 VanZ family protein [Actinomycetota bacterium]